MTQILLIIYLNAANQTLGNVLSLLLGYEHDPANLATFSIPLSADSKEPVEKYALRCTCSTEIQDIIVATGLGNPPPVDGMTEQEVLDAFALLTIDISTSSGNMVTDVAYFESFIAGEGLGVVDLPGPA